MTVSILHVAASLLVPGGKLRIAMACVFGPYASNLLCFHVLRAYKKYEAQKHKVSKTCCFPSGLHTFDRKALLTMLYS